MIPQIHVEERTKYDDHTGDVYVFRLKSEDGAKEIELIWATSPTTSYFNDAPIGSILFNLAASGLAYYKQDATTWVELGDLT